MYSGCITPGSFVIFEKLISFVFQMITGDFRRREKYLKFPCYFLKCLYIYF